MNQKVEQILTLIREEEAQFERYYFMYTNTDQRDFRDHLLLVMENQFATINLLTQELSHSIRMELIRRRDEVLDELEND